MGRKLRDSVVVVTGAASGIGLATAYGCANRGAAVVLAGRQSAALEAVAQECREAGAQALAMPTDMTDEAAVDRLARRAVEQFGRIDVWVNNAAVTAFGGIEAVPSRIFRRVVETNLYGCLYGTRAALPLMREQGSGVLVNVASGVVFAPQPYTAAYVASKAAIRALADCVRMELLLEKADGIHVCTVYPASIDTPLFQRGANYSGRAVRPMPPVHEPEEVAAAILDAAEHPRRAITVGVPRRTAQIARALAPAALERTMAQRVDREHFEDRPTAHGDGNLFAPQSRRPELRGGWGGRAPRRSGASALAAVALAGAAFLAWQQRRALARLVDSR